MFLKILPDLDMPLISLDTKNYYPKFNRLGDMVIVISKTQIPFIWTPCTINFGESEILVNRNYASLVNWNSILTA